LIDIYELESDLLKTLFKIVLTPLLLHETNSRNLQQVYAKTSLAANARIRNFSWM